MIILLYYFIFPPINFFQTKDGFVINNHSQVCLRFFFSSVTNIKYWMRSDAIIPKTLQLLSDLSVGYPFKLN
jgi:hypothetical protein